MNSSKALEQELNQPVWIGFVEIIYLVYKRGQLKTTARRRRTQEGLMGLSGRLSRLKRICVKAFIKGHSETPGSSDFCYDWLKKRFP